jgi:hypothetical protein
MSTGVLVNVCQLSLGIDLANPPAAVDEEHVSLRVDNDAGSRVDERSAGEYRANHKNSQNPDDE